MIVTCPSERGKSEHSICPIVNCVNSRKKSLTWVFICENIPYVTHFSSAQRASLHSFRKVFIVNDRLRYKWFSYKWVDVAYSLFSSPLFKKKESGNKKPRAKMKIVAPLRALIRYLTIQFVNSWSFDKVYHDSVNGTKNVTKKVTLLRDLSTGLGGLYIICKSALFEGLAHLFFILKEKRSVVIKLSCVEE